jgi:signal transduction histidine kinase/CheY-like chemotaxis protein
MLNKFINQPFATDSEMKSDFLESGFRTLIYATGGILLIGYILAIFLDIWGSVPEISVVIFILAGFSGFALYFLSRNLLTAQLLWLAGCFLAITATVYFSGIPELAFLFSLLPILAATLIGWVYGLLVTIGLIALFWALPIFLVFPGLPDALGLVILVTGAVGSLVAWSYYFSLQTFYQWARSYYQLAQEEIEGVKEQRIEFMELQEDQALANKELKRLTDQLDILYQRAEEARKTKEEFVANVSHELRTPLNMIIGFSDVIMKNPKMYGENIPGALLADIASIHRNSQHLSRLVDDVLDLSQVEAQKIAITKDWASIIDIIQEALGAVQALYTSKGLYLRSELPENCPPIFCDSTRLRQVVINLLSNAGRYTVTGGVIVRAWTENENMIITVSDTGPGISDEDQKKIFQPFQQLGDVTQKKGGSGLGLSISQKFVELHNGKMWLESEIGKGTQFFVSIPISPYKPVYAGTALEWERFFKSEDQYEVRTRRMKIPPPVVKPRYMLVEEGSTLKRLFERYLDEIDIVTQADISEAIHELSQSPFQALIMNTPDGMEDMISPNGLENLPLGTPLFSCWVPGRDDVARQLDVVQYLLKPATQEDIVSAVQALGDDIQRILLVDDETELLQLFSRMLLAANPDYRILQTFDGKRALNLMRTRQPDVVLLDLVMPGIDGFQILQEKRRDESIRDIPVIVVSSINPTGERIVSNSLSVSRKEGLSVHELIECIQNINKVLHPSQDSQID